MKLPKNKKVKISYLSVCFVILVVSFGFMLGTRLHSGVMLLPIGSHIHEMETEYEELRNGIFSKTNELAYYNSSELIRMKAEEDLNMGEPEVEVYLVSDNLTVSTLK